MGYRFGLGEDYAEAEGITYALANPDPYAETAIQAGERFVQWAEATMGAPTLNWSEKNAQTRYNLGQFWSLKAEHYGTDPNAWDALDLRAHQAWASLADLGLVADNPPAQTRYANEAQEAYQKAQQIAARINPRMVQTFQNRANQSINWNREAKAKGVDSTLKAAVEKSTRDLFNAGPFGIPLWAWALGIVGLILVVKKL